MGKHQKRGQPGNSGQFASDNRGATPPKAAGTPTTQQTTSIPSPSGPGVEDMYESFKAKDGTRPTRHRAPKVARWYNSMNPGAGKRLRRSVGWAGAAGFGGLIGLTIGGTAGAVIVFGAAVAIGYFAYRAANTLRQGGRNARHINQQAEFADRHHFRHDPREAVRAAQEARKNMRWPRPKLDDMLREQNNHLAAQLRSIRGKPHNGSITVRYEAHARTVHMRFKETDSKAPLGSTAWNLKEPVRAEPVAP